MWNWFKKKDESTARAVRPLKKAIAILPYNNFEYFRKTLDGILSQHIDNRSVLEDFDLFIFQDALQERHSASNAQYEEIKKYCEEKIPLVRFHRQEKNQGIALQFDYAETFLFSTEKYDVVILCEHDFVMAPNYLNVVSNLINQFADDERIAAVSAHSSGYRASQEEQQQRKNEYVVMGHDWGAAVFRRAWLKRVSVMSAYYELLRGIPFEQRNNLLIHAWMRFLGFYEGSTSQDTIKACVDSALGQLRISSFPNLGTYIGEQGMHWDRTIYESFGYHQTVLFQGEYGKPASLGAEQFQKLLAQQQASYLANAAQWDQHAFKKRIENNDLMIEVTPNLLRFDATSEDVVAAYKFFLNRFPESLAVIESRIGKPISQLLRSFLLSDECLNRQENWPIIIEAAKRVIEKNKQK